jgi:hypothetical protein
MKNILLILTIALISCSSNDDNLNKNINFSLIGQGQLHGNGAENIEKSSLVIKNITSWNELIDKLNTANNVSDDFAETDIDFFQYLIIAVFDKIYSNGDHSIDITSIVENETNMTVKVDKLMAGDDTQVITQPFHIVKIPKTEKPIIFE